MASARETRAIYRAVFKWIEADNDIFGGVLAGTKKAREKRGEAEGWRRPPFVLCTAKSSKVNTNVVARIRIE